MVVKYNNLIEFEYANFAILINPFAVNTGNWQMGIGYILARNAHSLNADKLTTGRSPVDITN